MSDQSNIKSTLPDPGTWTLDAGHSWVEFALEHFNVGIAKGLAAGPTGSLTIASDLEQSTATAVIDATTVTTANAMRDGLIQGADVLETEKYPTIDFTSTSLRKLGDTKFELLGNLTLRGITKPLTLTVESRGVMVDVKNRTRLGLTATGEINRNDFGAGEWGHMPLALGGFMVPHEVTVTLHLEATKDEPAA